MKKYFGIFFAVFALTVCCSSILFSESLSDLNVSGFDAGTKPKGAAVKNPFVSQKPSPRDLMVSDLNLTGIVVGGHEAYALISGFTVREGDEIAGYKVKAIDKDSVVLRQLDQVKVLRLE